MSQGKPDIGIVYIKNTFEPCELNEVTTELEEYGLKLMTHEKSPYINASIDFFVPFLRILVSPEICWPLTTSGMRFGIWSVLSNLGI